METDPYRIKHNAAAVVFADSSETSPGRFQTEADAIKTRLTMTRRSENDVRLTAACLWRGHSGATRLRILRRA